MTYIPIIKLLFYVDVIGTVLYEYYTDYGFKRINNFPGIARSGHTVYGIRETGDGRAS